MNVLYTISALAPRVLVRRILDQVHEVLHRQQTAARDGPINRVTLILVERSHDFTNVGTHMTVAYQATVTYATVPKQP